MGKFSEWAIVLGFIVGWTDGHVGKPEAGVDFLPYGGCRLLFHVLHKGVMDLSVEGHMNFFK